MRTYQHTPKTMSRLRYADRYTGPESTVRGTPRLTPEGRPIFTDIGREMEAKYPPPYKPRVQSECLAATKPVIRIQHHPRPGRDVAHTPAPHVVPERPRQHAPRSSWGRLRRWWKALKSCAAWERSATETALDGSGSRPSFDCCGIPRCSGRQGARERPEREE